MYILLKNFFSKFSKKKASNNSNITNEDKMNTSVKLQQRTYDILVFDYDDNGKQTQTPMNGVKAASASELISLYKRCGQDIKILREYGNDSDEPNLVESPVLKEPGIRPEQATDFGQTINQTFNQRFPPMAKRIDATPVKYFNIGGIECKLENNKVYQKQWVKIGGTEAQNYRVIQDATNKEISMTGKHFEVLKWVLIDEGNDGTIEKELNLING